VPAPAEEEEVAVFPDLAFNPDLAVFPDIAVFQPYASVSARLPLFPSSPPRWILHCTFTSLNFIRITANQVTILAQLK
jgi:hypothetical protein